MIDARLLWTARGFAAGFALGLLLSLVRHSRIETALTRGLAAAALLALAGLLAASLNRIPKVADEGDGATP